MGKIEKYVRRVCGGSLIAFAMVALAARGDIQLMGLAQSPAGATVPNGTALSVSITAAPDSGETVESVSLAYRTLATGAQQGWHTNAMSLATGSTWTGTVPRLPTGAAEYFVTAADGNGATYATAATQFTVDAELGGERFSDFTLDSSHWVRDDNSAWKYNGSSTTYTNWYFSVRSGTDQWQALNALVQNRSQGSNEPDGFYASRLFLRSIKGAKLVSPVLPEGVGTIYFTSSMFTANVAGQLDIQATTDPTADINGEGWETIKSVAFNGNKSAEPVIVNRADLRRVRFVRAGGIENPGGQTSMLINESLIIDNVAISCPPAAIVPAAAVVTPVQPDITTPVTFSIEAVSADAGAPALDPVATLHLRPVDGIWEEQAATFSGDTASTAPMTLSAGTYLYYFSVGFDGASYSRDPDRSGAQPTFDDGLSPYVSITNTLVVNTQNTRIIGLSGDLDFGLVATNDSRSLELVISNSGNAPLSVEEIVIPAGFTAVPGANFTVPADGVVTSVVTFAPVSVENYDGTLTVVSDATDGNDTVDISAEGQIAQEIAIGQLQGPSSGTRLENLQFATSAIDNYDGTLQYRFDWGDAQTSAWAVASSQSHAWQSIGSFDVRAQARSADTGFESAWTEAISVVITNTTIIRLAGAAAGGAIDLGDVQLTKSGDAILSIYNDGTGPFTISDISVPRDFSVSPQDFPLEIADGSNAVFTVTFTPSALGEVSGTLTVFSDAISGVSECAVSGTGIETEFVSTPDAPTGPEGGVRTYKYNFSTISSNLYGDVVEYRFDWGDNSTSEWARVMTGVQPASQQHSWQELGDYAVRAQSRCGLHPDVISDWSDAAYITITNVRLASVSGAIAFGGVATNATRTLNFTVYNQGTEDLTVTSFDCPEGYSASPSAFVLGVGSNQVVTVTFAPDALGEYAGAITVVSDAMNAAPTVNVTGTGIEAEMIFNIALEGPTSGIRRESLNYTASASNNWANMMQYRFDWGDSGEPGGWGNAAQPHAWQTTGEFEVKVQARSRAHPEVLSDWSAPLLVTIEDTRILSIQAPDLVPFMSVITNEVATTTLRVANQGTGPLTVTNIVFDPVSVFSADPVEFVVAAGAFQDVVLTFAPVEAGDYSSTLTVLSDKTSGGDTVEITADATDRELISTPTLETDVGWYATTNQSLRFIAAAETSFARVGHTVAYQFDWDDDDVTGWLANGTQSHSWPTFGRRTVKVQARCATDESYSEITTADVAILDELSVSVGNALNGKPVSVQVAIPRTNGVATACAIHVIPSGSTATSFQSIPLLSNGDGTWSGQIPSLGAGAMEYYVTYTLPGIAGEIQWPYDGTTLDAMVSEDLGDARFTDFASWVRDDASRWYYSGNSSTYTNWYRVVGNDRWVAVGANIANTTDAYSPNGFFSYRCYLRSIQGAYLQSPMLSGGVGTIYFTSTVMNEGHPATLEVQVTTADDIEYAEWETVATIEYPGTAGENQHAPAITLNRRDITCVRFVRTSINTSDISGNLITGAVSMDNVAISYPPASVEISQEFLPMPAYPSLDESVTVRCRVTDIYDDYPCINRNVTVWYRRKPDGAAAGAWQSAAMEEIGPDLYQGVIPAQEPGRIYYYYRCDFDGYHYSRDPDRRPNGTANGPQPLNDENLSPVFGYTEEDADGNYYYNYPVRRFLSDCEYLSIESDSVREDLREMSLVGDYTWQGIVSVSEVTNLLWTFHGVNGYTNNAVEFEAEDRVWAENDQDFPYPPVAGLAERDGTNVIQALLEYDGFLLLRIDTVSTDYIVKRAVYQDFNAWQADDTHFEESLGKFAVQTFQDDVNSWSLDTYSADRYAFEPFNDDPVSNDYATVPATTTMKWTMNQAKVIAERRTNSNVVANHALNMSHLTGGSVGNSGLSLTEGIHTLGFKARASIDDDYYMIYKNSAAMGWNLPYTVTTSIRANEISNAKAYVSVLVCFQTGFFTAGSFYEVRVVQDDVRDGTNARYRIAVYRWSDGVPTLVGEDGPFDGQLVATPKELKVNVVNNNNKVTLTVTYNNRERVFDDNSAARLTSGSIGFRCFDAVPEISSLEVKSGADTRFAKVTDFTKLTESDWYWGGKRSDVANNPPNRWTVNSGKVITRVVPTQTIQTYVAPADGVTVADYEKFVAVGSPVTVNRLTYTATTQTLNRWDESFVQLRVVSGDVPVVVDDLSVTPWRATTRDFENDSLPDVAGVVCDDWSSWSSQQYAWVRNVGGWAVLEGWIGTSTGSTGREFQFDRSRANTNIVQALISPVMTNGIGSIAFDYRTVGTVHFAIERSNEGDPSTYTEVTNAVVSAATATRYSCAIRENYNGRIRVRILDDTDPDAVLKIDNLVARDYPPRAESDWVAYNVLITDQQPTRLYEGQSCYLNNSTTRDIVGGALDAWAPYVQTPKVGTGIGEIGFWCRAWDLGGTGELEFRVCKEVDSEDDSFLTNIVVNSGTYEYISIEPYDIENMVLRIYASTNSGMSRVCIDEIVMTEPVRAGYEIFDVSLVLDDPESQQPLYTDRVGVEAKIGRFLMNPQDIKLHVSYFVGSNTWGVANWRGYELDPARGCVTLDMEPVGDNVYRTPANARIPAQPIDQVVQYVVWGTYDGIEGRPVLMEPPDDDSASGGRWTNPAWYYPVDLNAGSGEWSPYYFSYSCPPRSVWINEINYPVKISTEAGMEYVELIGHTGYDIGNWRIEVVAPYESMTDLYRSADIPAGTSLADDELTPEEISWGYGDYYDIEDDGWSFYVWGDAGMWPEADLEVDDDTAYMLPQNGGIRLVRSMGAYEHAVSYGPGDLARELADYGYEYIGYKFTLPPVESPIQLQGDGTSVTNFYWYQPSSYTYSAGRPNIDQNLSNVVVVVTKYYVYSILNASFGSQIVKLNDRIVQYPTDGSGLEVEKGQKVEFEYRAKPWCVIESLDEDGTPVQNAAGGTSWISTYRDIRQDHSNHVEFVLGPDYHADGISDADMQAWLAGKYATARALDTDGYNIDVEYALDTDPTVNDEYDLSIVGLNLDRTTGRATVDFTIENGGSQITSLQSPVAPADFFLVDSTASLSNIDWQPVGNGTVSYVAADGVWRWTSDAVLPSSACLRVRIPNPSH